MLQYSMHGTLHVHNILYDLSRITARADSVQHLPLKKLECPQRYSVMHVCYVASEALNQSFYEANLLIVQLPSISLKTLQNRKLACILKSYLF